MSKYKGEDETSIVDSLLDLPGSIRESKLRHIAYHGKYAQHVFIKDFPYHSQQAFDKLLTKDFIHTFLVRNPYETIMSWQNINPEFEESELGYVELLYSIRKAKKSSATGVFAINSDKLVNDAQDVIRRYCEYVGLPYLASMCEWRQREPIPAWNTWEKYHKDAQQSSGFSKNARAGARLTERNKQLYENARPVYELILAELGLTI